VYWHSRRDGSPLAHWPSISLIPLTYTHICAETLSYTSDLAQGPQLSVRLRANPSPNCRALRTGLIHQCTRMAFTERARRSLAGCAFTFSSTVSDGMNGGLRVCSATE
jgi:hypothetical protein